MIINYNPKNNKFFGSSSIKEFNKHEYIIIEILNRNSFSIKNDLEFSQESLNNIIIEIRDFFYKEEAPLFIIKNDEDSFFFKEKAEAYNEYMIFKNREASYKPYLLKLENGFLEVIESYYFVSLSHIYSLQKEYIH